MCIKMCIKITSHAFDSLCQRNQYYNIGMINYFNTHINFNLPSGTHCGKITRECLQILQNYVVSKFTRKYKAFHIQKKNLKAYL